MVSDTLSQQRPSRDETFANAVVFAAISQSDTPKVSQLLNTNPQLIGATNEAGQTPLEALTRTPFYVWADTDSPRRTIYQLLVSKGAIPDRVAAIVAGDEKKVKEFMNADAGFSHTPLEVEGHQRLPLSLAAMFNRTDVMELLISAGADVNADTENALALAASMQHVEASKLLLAHGAQLNPTDTRTPPLHHACYDISPRTALFLLDQGADPNVSASIRDVEGSPLMMALQTYNRWDGEWKHQIIEALIEKGADVEDDVILALHRGRTDLFMRHLDTNPALIHQRFELPDYNTYCPLYGGSLLHLVAEYNEYPNALQCVRELLERGADINAQAERNVDGVGGHTPIFHALQIWLRRSEELLDFLIKRGANLTVKGTFLINGEKLNLTPLGYELRRQPNPPYATGTSQKVVEILRRHGAPEE